VESTRATGEVAPVYNLRVEEYHTYFVGSAEWGFSVWAHNACVNTTTGSQEEALEEVIRQRGGVNDPGLIERIPDYSIQGPNGEPSEIIRTLDPTGNEIIDIPHHPWGHYFPDDGTVLGPHFNGPEGHIFYPPGT
jgi:hypothetical protein